MKTVYAGFRYYLKSAEKNIKTVVVEKDPAYTYASSTLSMANIRIQFSLKKNIQISQYAFDFLDRFEEEMAVDDEKPDISFRREGNLFLVDEAGKQRAERAMTLQKSLGCQVEWWPREQIEKQYALYNLDGYVGGTFLENLWTMTRWDSILPGIGRDPKKSFGRS